MCFKLLLLVCFVALINILRALHFLWQTAAKIDLNLFHRSFIMTITALIIVVGVALWNLDKTMLRLFFPVPTWCSWELITHLLPSGWMLSESKRTETVIWRMCGDDGVFSPALLQERVVAEWDGYTNEEILLMGRMLWTWRAWPHYESWH